MCRNLWKYMNAPSHHESLLLIMDILSSFYRDDTSLKIVMQTIVVTFGKWKNGRIFRIEHPRRDGDLLGCNKKKHEWTFELVNGRSQCPVLSVFDTSKYQTFFYFISFLHIIGLYDLFHRSSRITARWSIEKQAYVPAKWQLSLLTYWLINVKRYNNANIIHDIIIDIRFMLSVRKSL